MNRRTLLLGLGAASVAPLIPEFAQAVDLSEIEQEDNAVFWSTLNVFDYPFLSQPLTWTCRREYPTNQELWMEGLRVDTTPFSVINDGTTAMLYTATFEDEQFDYLSSAVYDMLYEAESEQDITSIFLLWREEQRNTAYTLQQIVQGELKITVGKSERFNVLVA